MHLSRISRATTKITLLYHREKRKKNHLVAQTPAALASNALSSLVCNAVELLFGFTSCNTSSYDLSTNF